MGWNNSIGGKLYKGFGLIMGIVVFAFVLTTGFFAAAMALCQPRYLPLFRAMLHPHRPW